MRAEMRWRAPIPASMRPAWVRLEGRTASLSGIALAPPTGSIDPLDGGGFAFFDRAARCAVIGSEQLVRQVLVADLLLAGVGLRTAGKRARRAFQPDRRLLAGFAGPGAVDD